jgi:hypothetical protein
VHTANAVLHARHITMPNPKRGGLLNVKIKSSKSTLYDALLLDTEFFEDNALLSLLPADSRK